MNITRGVRAAIAAMWAVCLVMLFGGTCGAQGNAGQSNAGVLDATLCDTDTIPAAITREIVRESIAIFEGAGITLRLETSSERECGMSGAGIVLARVENSPVRYADLASREPVASIKFIDGRPDRTITLSLSSARYLLWRDAATRALLARVSSGVEQRWVGRMLGRALAHELGHYLLRSPRHYTTGLMRATHTVQAFLDPARTAFRLGPEERQALLLGVVEAPRGHADAAQR